MLISLITLSLAASISSQAIASNEYVQNLPTCAADTPEDTICIIDHIARGSGCTKDAATLSTKTVNGKLELGLKYGELFVQKYEGTRAKESRKSCTLALNIRIPEGTQIAADNLSFDGTFAYLDEGMALRISTSTSFPHAGENASSKSNNSLAGRYVGFFGKAIDPTPSELAWSSCDSTVPLNIKTSLHVRGRTQGAATINKLKFNLKTKECD